MQSSSRVTRRKVSRRRRRLPLLYHPCRVSRRTHPIISTASHSDLSEQECQPLPADCEHWWPGWKRTLPLVNSDWMPPRILYSDAPVCFSSRGFNARTVQYSIVRVHLHPTKCVTSTKWYHEILKIPSSRLLLLYSYIRYNESHFLFDYVQYNTCTLHIIHKIIASPINLLTIQCSLLESSNTP